MGDPVVGVLACERQHAITLHYRLNVSDGDYEYHYDEAPASAPVPGPPRLRFVPVSQISTPPTITTTSRPYGEIVNRWTVKRILLQTVTQ